MTPKINDRKKYIDIAKLIAVSMVLLDHVQYNGINVGPKFMTGRVIWIAFFLPVFYFSAGLTTNFNRDSFGVFIKKRFHSILVPYFIWCFILKVSGSIDLNFVKGVLLGTKDSLTDAGVNSVLWFMPSFFVASIIAYLCVKLTDLLSTKLKINKIAVSLVEIVALAGIDRVLNSQFKQYLYFGLSSAFHGAGLILFGVLLKPLFDKLYEKKALTKLGVFAVAVAVGVPLAFVNMPVVNTDGLVGYQYAIWMANGDVGRNIALYFVVTVLMSSSIFVLSMLLEKISVLAYFGQRSMMLMTLHIYSHLIVGKYIVPAVFGYIPSYTHVLAFFVISVAIISVALPIIDKCFPFLYKRVKV